jgi:arginine decarboxylase
VDKFCDKRTASKPTLDLHDLKPGVDRKPEAYHLGIFLLGAYQEVLGDLHNLYGDTHVVHVSFDDSDGVGDWDLDEVVEGDTVKEVLSYVQYDTEDLIKAMRKDVERAVKGGLISVPEGQSLLKFYDQGMEGYTYLE